MTRITDVRDFAEVTAKRLERCVGIAGQCHCRPSVHNRPSVLVGHTGALSVNVSIRWMTLVMLTGYR